MNIKLLGDRLLAEIPVSKNKTSGGIIIPDTAKSIPQESVVVAVSAGTKLNNGKYEKLCVKVGQKILFGRGAGEEIEVEGRKFLLLRNSDVIAIIK